MIQLEHHTKQRDATAHSTDSVPLYHTLLAQLRLLPATEALLVLKSLDPALLKTALQPDDTLLEDKANRRGSRRNRTLRSGKIIYNNQMCVLDCLIRDISLTGCRIRVANPGMVPSRFVLQVIGTNQKHDCDICWRTAQEIGVKFSG